MEPLDVWVERQYRHSATAMLRSVSPIGIVKRRPGFAQTVRPRRGSIVASPVLGAYDPEPDYFFHWFRDSAIIIDALRLLFEDTGSRQLLLHFADFVQFSLSLQELDGRRFSGPARREAVAPDFLQYLRTDEDLGAVRGAAVSGETRVNPDGTLDISRWPRPQNDGPALRALTLLRWLTAAPLDAELAAAVESLLRADLRYTLRHWRESSFDIWEEEKGLHYYTLRAAAGALTAGADWLERHGEESDARMCRSDARNITNSLDGYWREDLQFYRSRMLEAHAPSTKELDISVIFAAIHAGENAPLHSVRDPRMHATLSRLEALFEAEYAINRNRGAGRAPALGRYAGDVYYSGGAYYFSTLAAAEFCFRAAAHSPAAKELMARGDAYLETVRAYTPPSGDLSEQFDQHTGVQRSAQQLAWSYAAFISCTRARRRLSQTGA
ncbi:MAG TPA: glycoside hydrolase family 15 protein [Steroidobacteraceae bacterium]|jgi:glucoamylase|nr:glycoside hydrolase family 15 protein [Steroidobacteraceae bacterium]